ncbi:MAG: hypothetical protein QM770_24670 [Tepidisphaeraceae bacterium]
MTPDDLALIVKKLVAKAKRGDVKAAREVLNRCIGKPVAADTREKIEISGAGDLMIAARMRQLRRLDVRAARGDELNEHERMKLSTTPRPELATSGFTPSREREVIEADLDENEDTE